MEKKVLTISIAAYNVEKYIENALDSLIIARNLEEIEILIINDGSTDSTSRLAAYYVEQYPEVFKLVNKENGGYGSTINEALKRASGKYFKQLDGDDWFDSENVADFVDFLKVSDADCIYSPFWKVYQHKGRRELQTSCNMNGNKLNAKDISMHALTYKTSIFVKNQIFITENCFYTDCEYNIKPLMFVNKIEYFNKPVYCYRLGEAGQSVSKEGWKKHYKEHIKVTLELMKYFERYKEKVNSVNKNNIEEYIIQVYKTNFNIALEFSNNMIRKEFVKLDEIVKVQFPYFYRTKNKKINILRKSKYKVWWVIEIAHKLFEKITFE